VCSCIIINKQNVFLFHTRVSFTHSWYNLLFNFSYKIAPSRTINRSFNYHKKLYILTRSSCQKCYSFPTAIFFYSFRLTYNWPTSITWHNRTPGCFINRNYIFTVPLIAKC
jgi:hypothetical protein